MPQFAWQALVRELMVEAEMPSQEKLAEAIDIHKQTVSRWFGHQPAFPSAESFRKVAAFANLSPGALRWRWTLHMHKRYSQFAAEADVCEASEGPEEVDELRVVTEARELAKLDLGDVLPEQAPSLHQMRDRMEKLADTVEALVAALRALVASYIAVYQAAIDGARRVKRDLGG